jgi:hypothetical protein
MTARRISPPPPPDPTTCLNDSNSVGYARCTVEAALDNLFFITTVTTRPGEILVGPFETEFQGRLGFRSDGRPVGELAG